MCLRWGKTTKMPLGGAANVSSTATRRPEVISASTSQVLRQAMPQPPRHQSCSTWPSEQSSGPPGLKCTTSLVRSEEHTSELQSPCNLVCRLLLEKKKKKDREHPCTRLTSCVLLRDNRTRDHSVPRLACR